MQICLHLAFEAAATVRLLNWLAQENALILRERPDLPHLLDAGVRYEREEQEDWLDYLSMLLVGKEDCDGLAAADAGGLLARGAAWLRPGDGGYAEARRRRLRSIEAQVFVITRTRPGEPGLYHCIVRYRVGARWYRRDPSARLGMNGSDRRDPYGDRPEA